MERDAAHVSEETILLVDYRVQGPQLNQLTVGGLEGSHPAGLVLPSLCTVPNHSRTGRLFQATQFWGSELPSNRESEQGRFVQRRTIQRPPPPDPTVRTAHHHLPSFVFSTIFLFSLSLSFKLLPSLKTQFKTFSPWFCFCLSLLECLPFFSLEDLPFSPLVLQVFFTTILL